MTGPVRSRPASAPRRLALGLLALVAVEVAGCGMPPPPGGQGPGRRQQVLALSPRQELEVGLEAYRKVLEEYSDRILPSDAPESRRVHRVLGRLIKAAGIEPLQREINLQVRGYYFQWEVHVVQDRKVNAFCLPAGKMIVFTGLMRVVQNDDQLATVLGHEMAHALAHHASERVATAQREGRGALAILSSLAHDRQQETEADHIGLFLMTFAGYNPEEAVRFWQRMMQVTGASGGRPEILSDHPSDARRIRDLQGWVPQVVAAKRAYDEGRIAPARAARRGPAVGAEPTSPRGAVVYSLRRGT
jgi:predicted Zn-dependent protease